jgi:phosphoribosylformylglycinamidine synthase PurS subunit
MSFYVYIAIERKEAILDPSGKATEHALSSLGFSGISNTRIGKLVRLKIEAETADAARQLGEEAARKLLANAIMEEFSVIEVTDQPHLSIIAHA